MSSPVISVIIKVEGNPFHWPLAGRCTMACAMKCAMVFTGSGPLVVVTCYDSLNDPGFLRRLAEKGIDKFITFELPLEAVRERYGNHFNVVCEDLNETDELRVVDYEGDRALSLFEFSEFGPAVFHETPRRPIAV